MLKYRSRPGTPRPPRPLPIPIDFQDSCLTVTDVGQKEASKPGTLPKPRRWYHWQLGSGLSLNSAPILFN